MKFGYVALDKCEQPPRQTSGVTRALVARAETIKCAPVGGACIAAPVLAPVRRPYWRAYVAARQ